MEYGGASTSSSSLMLQEDVVSIDELEYFVQSVREFRLDEIGSNLWMDSHEFIIKLSQQATLEATSYREETVKEMLIVYSKLSTLIHEAYCIRIWKIKILPILMEIDSNPPATFLIYNVLFHEGVIVTLLEFVLFHQNGCESLGETAIDLIDYCTESIIQMIGLIQMRHHETFADDVDVDDSTITELERQKSDISYKIGLRCISILNYLVDKSDNLLLNVGKRMVTIHDIPCLLCEVLHLKPWIRKTSKGFEKFIDEKWQSVEGDKMLKITKTEAQTWFCLRQILFNTKIMELYEINDFRCRKLTKCKEFLNEIILDQLPPLIELKQYLNNLSITGCGYNKSGRNLQNLLLEDVPQIKQKIIDDVKNEHDDHGFDKIAKKQAKIFLTNEKLDILSIAKRLNQAYNFDFFAKIQDKKNENANDEKNKKKEMDDIKNYQKICGNCKKDAQKKCSNCLSVYYCSRECQQENWFEHKKFCTELRQKITLSN